MIQLSFQIRALLLAISGRQQQLSACRLTACISPKHCTPWRRDQVVPAEPEAMLLLFVSLHASFNQLHYSCLLPPTALHFSAVGA